MDWSPQQQAAIEAVQGWLADPAPQVFRLFGYAGSGKTTLAKHLAEGAGRALFGAFTGKAALVLRQKGCPASTIHSLIYTPKESSKRALRQLEEKLIQLPDDTSPEERAALEAQLKAEQEKANRPMFSLKLESEVESADLVVIDECSMVDERMGLDLLSFGTPVLVLGDPAQLPPVGGAGFFTENCTPDVLLTEIHRQAAGNPILDMATTVRQGGRPNPGAYGDSRVLGSGEKLTPEMALGVDQIIVGRNATRYATNKRVRELLGRTDPSPVPGDKLVCLRNDHDKGLLNGSLWVVEEAQCGEDLAILTLTPVEGGEAIVVDAHMHYFQGRGKELNWWEKKDAQEFDYGYALTCHKAQGSQWGSVLVVDESEAFRQDRHRWLYTAITRAADRVLIA